MASLGAGFFLQQLNRNGEVFRSICDLTENNFYRDGEPLRKWVRSCRKEAAQVSGTLNRSALVAQIQNLMGLLNVSHFSIYTPSEDKKMWKGVAVDTGIRSRYVDDHLMVYKVLKGSSAAAAGLRPGDEIVEIEGATQVTPWGAQNRSGRFTYMRGLEMRTATVQATELNVDGGPTLERLSPSTAMLDIPSFRSEFFQDWNKIRAGLGAYSHLVVDLRENAGGNFVAMLRALSTFQCGSRSAGKLVRPRQEGEEKAAIDDNTEDAFQLEELGKYSSLGLITFGNYGCYRGRVTVLIGSDTSSVAEIFAYNMRNRPNTSVLGQPTAGDVVLAVWYDLPALGPGFSVSIPEAEYLTPENGELENHGVSPHREVFYDLAHARAGHDTLVVEALKN